MNYLFHSSHPRNKNKAYAFFKAGFIESWGRGYLKIQDEPETDYTTRYLHWTEDNRLHTVADERHYSYYAYDYSGERTLKMTSDASEVDQNALEQHIFSSLGSVTLYPSPYIVVSDHSYTKHYYAGTERVAARIGTGGLSHDTPCISQDDGVTRRTDSLFLHNWELIDQYEYKKAENLDIVRIDGTVLEDADRFNRDKIPVHLHSEVKVEPWKLQRVIEVYSEPVFPPVNPPVPPPDPGEPSEEPEVFFYHSDHLGSASWITDGGGNPVQHLQYLPYAYCAYTQPTGGHEHRLIKFNAVNNPVKLVDSDGRDWYRTTDADGKVHELWMKRSAATYTDKDGHEWTNIGTDRVTLRNNTVIHQFQTIDKNGEYHLHTKTYTDNNLYNSMLAIAGLYSSATEMMAEQKGTSFTFRYNQSAKGIRLTFDHNWGGGGRAHIKPIKLAPILRTAGKVFLL